MLLFVLRDKTKTPLPRLVETMEADLIKMWDSISKPPQYVDSKISDFFELQYAGLPHYEEKYEDFLADTVVLRRRFTPEGEACPVSQNSSLDMPSIPPPFCPVVILISPYLVPPMCFLPTADDSLFRTDNKLPGDALTLSTGSIWEVIRSQKDLNLPAHKASDGVAGSVECFHGCACSDDVSR